jgi:hypothetical protein
MLPFKYSRWTASHRAGVQLALAAIWRISGALRLIGHRQLRRMGSQPVVNSFF